MPRYLLSYIVDGRVENIQSISTLDPDLCQVILAELARIGTDVDEYACIQA